jgi:hypothetical protein
MRAIIRISVDGEADGKLRNAMKAILTNYGFVLTGATATYENQNITLADLAKVMQAFWTLAENPATVPNVNPAAHLDHVWIYVDERG